ncbi:MAG: hypothetical protein ACFFD4_06535 [Candidatus Odinarchaeota archaeon]
MVSCALMYVIFDEDQGPVLRAIATHDIAFPRVILRGVVTTLFTMSVGIGEPEGLEPETAIVPVSITNARGRVMIFSFGIEDQMARGGRRMESFMLFIEKEHQNKFLQYSLAIVEVLTNTIEDIKTGKNPDTFTREAFEQIKRILLMEIDVEIQSRLDRICSEDEVSFISDGSVRAIYGFPPSHQLTNNISRLHEVAEAFQQLCLSKLGKSISVTSQYKRYSASLNVLQELEDSVIPFTAPILPLEIHGRVKNDISAYLLYQKDRIAVIYSRRRGRIGRLIGPLRNLLLGLETKSRSMAEYVKAFHLETEDTLKFSPSKESASYFNILENMKSVLKNYAVYQKEGNKYILTHIHNSTRDRIYKMAISLFETIDEITENILHNPVPQIVVTFSDQAFLLLKANQEGTSSCILVGESGKGVGFMRLISNEIQNKIKNLQ